MGVSISGSVEDTLERSWTLERAFARSEDVLHCWREVSFRDLLQHCLVEQGERREARGHKRPWGYALGWFVAEFSVHLNLRARLAHPIIAEPWIFHSFSDSCLSAGGGITDDNREKKKKKKKKKKKGKKKKKKKKKK